MSKKSKRSGKSLMYTVNNRGPGMEPCCTPIGAIARSD